MLSELKGKWLTEEARTPSIHPLWGCKLGRVETACKKFFLQKRASPYPHSSHFLASLKLSEGQKKKNRWPCRASPGRCQSPPVQRKSRGCPPRRPGKCDARLSRQDSTKEKEGSSPRLPARGWLCKESKPKTRPLTVSATCTSAPRTLAALSGQPCPPHLPKGPSECCGSGPAPHSNLLDRTTGLLGFTLLSATT